ncbi:MAG: hypothetical protein HZC28_01565 [Spirochaetes bacterium]|nr:hypothetical protein [Spirochaetota bacterium]
MHRRFKGIAAALAGVTLFGALAFAADKMVELTLKLPKAMFAGTPTKMVSPNLDPKSGQKRAAFMVPEGTKLISAKKKVTASDKYPVIGDLEQITDGDKEGGDGSFVELGPNKQWVQIDLGAKSTIQAIALWHYHMQARIYRDIVIQVAADADFITDVKTVYNSDHDNSLGLGAGKDYEYIETFEGRLIDAKGVTGRYVRLYSAGNTANANNHYIEVEVYGAQ